MKLFLVDHRLPPATDYANDERFQRYLELCSDLVCKHLADDPALFGLRHVGEVTAAPVPTNQRYGASEGVRITDRATLKAILRESCDPCSGKFMVVRSLVTCRAVLFGYDGQAFVCLPMNAPDIVTPDEDLITVENRSEMLIETDYLDGILEG